MRVQVEQRADDHAATPVRLHWGGRRVDVVETLDQWFGCGYKYVKLKGDDGGLYILRLDQPRDEWTLVLFRSARGQMLTT